MDTRIRWIVPTAALLATMACQPGGAVFADIGPAGGVVESESARLVIPPGALATKTMIVLMDEPEPVGAAVSVSVGPPDLVFQRDAYVELRYRPEAVDASTLLLWVSTALGWIPAREQWHQPDRHLFAAPVRLAGAFAVVAGRPRDGTCPGQPMPDSGYIDWWGREPWDAGYELRDAGSCPGGDRYCYPYDGGYTPRDAGYWPPYDGGYMPRDGGYLPPYDGGYPSRDGGYLPPYDGGYPSRDAGYWPPYDGGYTPRDAGYWPRYDGGGWLPVDDPYCPGPDGGVRADAG